MEQHEQCAPGLDFETWESTILPDQNIRSSLLTLKKSPEAPEKRLKSHARGEPAAAGATGE